jgi:thiamine transport system permease protein
VILILGGPGFATIEVEIYRQAIHLFNLPMAAALSVIQIGFTFGLMWLYTSLQRRSALPLHLTAASRNERPLANRRDKVIVWGAAGFMVALLIVPLLALAASSFQGPDGWTLTFYAALFENPAQSVFYVPPIRAALNSLLFAGFAAALAMVIGLSAAAYLAAPHGKMTSILDPVFMLPLSTSAVTLGFGFILALDRPPLNLRTSLALVPLAHTLVAFPFVVRSILPVMRGIPRGLREAAQVLGASPPRVWRTVDLPIITRGLLVGAVFAFAISMGEFGATAFTARPETPTMPLAVYRFLSRPGTMNYGQAMAMSTLLMAVTAAAFAALERLGGPREF